MLLFYHDQNHATYNNLTKRSISHSPGSIIAIVNMCVGWSIAGIMSIHKWQRNRNVRRRLQNDTICAVSSTENRTSVVAPPSIGTVPSEITMETTQYNPPPSQPNDSDVPNDFVPPYSETPQHANDMGYYDIEGKFHRVDSFKPPSSPPIAYTR
ncbi:predicted protein [Candida tropicalis MYA-3404]|uniref:Uncharacterized protein n=1 Tax=Candida tropicalis (strain ATCC MYA-3404 / T1) TaxID=294747 RepID=C5M7J9_CANTT|nr:predicted protein [Candida tropicalis MYA-3404]EER34969.1 predicted protein [Candida tropicalis MYA-3404]KAG4408853.1 hypothetical protein JTP64_002159 [Candida tropicalis]